MQATNLDYKVFKQRDFSNKLIYKAVVVFPNNGNLELPVYAFQIERDIDYVAQSCQLELHNISPTDINDAGYYSPDRVGTWSKVLWPGNKFQVKITVEVFDRDPVTNVPTHTAETFTMFTGYIDTVDMIIENSKSVLKIAARDAGSILMDNIIPEEFGSGDRWLEYSSVDISTIVRDLLLKAGFTEDDMGDIQPTGILVDIEFQDTKYGECIAQLMDICVYDFYFDENGKANFVKSFASGPVKTDTISFATETGYKFLGFDNDSYSVMIPKSDVVTSLDDTITYVRNVDYTIDYVKQTISRTAASSIPLSTDIKINWIVTAYHYKEGEDLYSLKYKISRNQMTGKVKVNGDGVEATYNNPNPTSYGVSANKINFISQNIYLITEEQCQEMANRLGNSMLRTFRRAEILGVGIPFLQFGDVLQITESITTASEVYRICAIKFTMNNGMLYTTARTYYYDHSPT
jgi:hypothetical protein